MKNTNIQNLGQVDVNKIVLDLFKDNFPGAPESEVNELIHDMGQTIISEASVKMVEEIEAKDPALAEEVKTILLQEHPPTTQEVARISNICLMPHVNIDMEEVFKIVATDVIQDVLRD